MNYIGGIDLGDATSANPQRVGSVMEFVPHNLRTLILVDRRFSVRRTQLEIAKQIASAMNFLHSLRPPVMVHCGFSFFTLI